MTFNSDLEDSDRLCFVGQNALQSGKVAAGLMAEILPKGAKVQVISGYPSNQSHRNRSEGFISELNAVRKDVEILVGKVKVISNDLTTRNEQELKRGLIQFLLGQNAYVQGYSPVMILFDKLFDGKESEEEHQYTEIVIKTKYSLRI